MGTLSYTATVSLDGFVADRDGDFQWTAPGEDVFRFHVERMDVVSTEILGRRTYELMKYWESEPEGELWGPLEKEFAEKWCRLDLVVASSTLTQEAVGSRRARVVSKLTLPVIREVVEQASGEVEIFGPTTAGEAIRAGLVQDFRFFVVPRIVGGGISALPADAATHLSLVEQRTFSNGAVYLHYTSR